MTKEKAKHLSEVLKAYSEGKVIEYRVWSSFGFYGEWDEWNGCSAFNQLTSEGKSIEYRIKPEPALRPYANAQEFLKASKEHGPYLCRDTTFFAILGFDDEGASLLSREYRSLNYMKYGFIAEEFVWQDGTPCGVKE